MNPATKRVLLKVAQPFDNHNGGQLQIGPDGLLYISLGDGGSAGDPNLNGQSKGPLATILRMDPTKPHPRAAMYAYGLRNPWRFSFDRKTGGMWIGDVGQDTWEEVDHLRHDTPRGTNFGWSFYEGRSVFKNQPIDRSRLRFPVAVYRHVVAGPTTARSPAATSTAGARSRASWASTSTPTSARAGSGRSPRAADARCSRT